MDLLFSILTAAVVIIVLDNSLDPSDINIDILLGEVGAVGMCLRNKSNSLLPNDMALCIGGRTILI